MNLNSLPLEAVLRKQRALRRELSANAGLRPIRIAVLGGATTGELVDLWELHLLSKGFQPVFYQSEYAQFYQDAVHGTAAVAAFAPDLAYVDTFYKNAIHVPQAGSGESDFAQKVFAETARFRQIWGALSEGLSCQIIQNNFDMPPYQLLGNLDSSAPGGASRYFLALNAEFAKEAAANKQLVIHDLHGLQNRVGSTRWFDWHRWFGYKIPYTLEANYEIASSLTAIVLALYGLSKKVLVLDLDNTCWGGVIGDDGVNSLQIGRETPVAEAYTAFQEYCLQLRDRGVLLAVCSKNDEAIARQGFEHPDSVLKMEHISAFKANWAPKHENILSIATELNLGLDSFVFVDDNPAERAIVIAQVPDVAVPDVGCDPALYPQVLNAGRYFEPVSLSSEDLERGQLYTQNAQRAASAATFESYGEYLDSLEMKAEIRPFSPLYLERITQLINKTNQFNLTTRRYTAAQITLLGSDPTYLSLYGKLFDRFGDNGIVSIVLGKQQGEDLHMDLWLMSCRVLKRDMELAMLDVLVEEARARKVKRILGTYIPTKKNDMVASHYQRIGFNQVGAHADDDLTQWSLDLDAYTLKNSHIVVVGEKTLG
jgi:FkbH-like protein